MLRFAPWKLASVLALVAAAILLVVPSFMPAGAVDSLAARLPGFIPMRQIVLGLDLQGGAYMLMQVDEASVIKSQVEALRDDVRQKMRDGKIGLSGGIATQARGVLVRIADPAERDKAYALLQSLSQPIGGPLAGGNGRTLDVSETDSGVQLTLTDAAIADKVRHAVAQSIEVLNRRINAMGTKETVVEQQGANRVLIEVPGLQDTTKLKQIIGQTAKLDFQLVADPGDPPNEVETLPMQKGGGTITVQKRIMVDGADLVDAQQSFDQQTGEPDVTFRFNLRGGAEVRAGHLGKRRPAVRHRARRQGHFGPGHPLADHRRHRPDHRQLHPRRSEQPGDPFARGRVAGQAHGGRGAHGRPRPRAGFDRRRQARRLCRRHSGRHLHDRDLRHFRRFRRSRARRAHPPDLRFDGPARGDADPARHRRHRVHHRHGGRIRTC